MLIIRKLYVIEKLARDARMTADERHRLRNEKARPIWDELRAWLDRNRNATPPQSLTGKAIVLCENAIRPFVVGRKAWLFCDTPAGAHASARLYSLVESAKANGLNVSVSASATAAAAITDHDAGASNALDAAGRGLWPLRSSPWRWRHRFIALRSLSSGPRPEGRPPARSEDAHEAH